MAMFGSSWFEDSKEVGPMSHWNEEEEVLPIENIDYNLCHKLRKNTGMGLMDCKKCLIDYDWDYEQAFKNYHKYQRPNALIHYSNE